MAQLFNPFKKLWDGCTSMLSETGKQSLKRGISALFAIAIVYMVWYFLNKTVAVENQPTLKYMFTGLCVMIALLTGVATVKDIIAFKNGQKADEQPEADKTA